MTRFQGTATYIVTLKFNIDDEWFGWEEDTPNRDDVENELNMVRLEELESSLFDADEHPKVVLTTVQWKESSHDDNP